MPKLKQRILTAIVLLPLVFWALFFTSSHTFAVLSAAVMLIAAWEWSRLSGWQHAAMRALYVVVIALLLVLASQTNAVFWLGLAGAGWLAALLWLIFCKQRQATTLGYAIVGVPVILPCWVALNVLAFQPVHPYWLLFLFLLVWGADTAAYFAGCRWGKHKLAPAISPGKSWEGAVAGLLCNTLLAVVAAGFLHLPWAKSMVLVLWVWLTTIFSVAGDLFESWLKRQQGLKDSSNLLPGHGGVMDRIDSLTAAAPIFALGLLVLGIY